MTRKAKPFEIRFFYEPDGQQLIHYWEKASKLGTKQSEFDKIWFKAYENFRALIAEEHFRKNYWKLCGVVLEHGNDEQKAAVQKILSKGLKQLRKDWKLDKL
jgi:hypothetical protein